MEEKWDVKKDKNYFGHHLSTGSHDTLRLKIEKNFKKIFQEFKKGKTLKGNYA